MKEKPLVLSDICPRCGAQPCGPSVLYDVKHGWYGARCEVCGYEINYFRSSDECCQCWNNGGVKVVNPDVEK